MASIMYNSGKAAFLKGDIDWEAATIMCLLVDNTHTPNADNDFVSDVVADEVTGTGYSRKTLASCVVNTDDTNDRAEADATDVTWTGLDCGTIAYAIIYKYGTGDSDSQLICCLDFADLTTNGGDVTLQWNSEGLFYV